LTPTKIVEFLISGIHHKRVQLQLLGPMSKVKSNIKQAQTTMFEGAWTSKAGFPVTSRSGLVRNKNMPHLKGNLATMDLNTHPCGKSGGGYTKGVMADCD